MRKSRKQQKNDRRRIVPITAKTINQKDYIRDIVENDVVFCTGRFRPEIFHESSMSPIKVLIEYFYVLANIKYGLYFLKSDFLAHVQ